MDYLEELTAKRKGWYVDLFVKKSNDIAVAMYRNLGYTVYQEVKNYYSGPNPENCYDMRKRMPRDVKKEIVVKTGKIINPRDLKYN